MFNVVSDVFNTLYQVQWWRSIIQLILFSLICFCCISQKDNKKYASYILETREGLNLFLFKIKDHMADSASVQ